MQAFREKALNPENLQPEERLKRNDDIYFQAREVQNRFYNRSTRYSKRLHAEISAVTGENTSPLYYGAEDAERVIIAMGSVTETIKETIDFLAKKRHKSRKLWQYICIDHFRQNIFWKSMPDTVKKIHDPRRTKSRGLWEPLVHGRKSTLLRA